MASKNPFGKYSKEGYFTLTSADWKYIVHKLYQKPDASVSNPYARAFCTVITPMTTSSGDMGDVYIREVPGLKAKLLAYMGEEVAKAYQQGA